MQSSSQSTNQEQEENLFSQLLFRYLPYWPLFTILLVISLGLAKIYLRYATPMFETTASILVKDEKKGVDDQNLMEQLDLFGSKKFVENEIEVVQSKVLMRQVVKNLNLYAPITIKGVFNSVSGYVMSPVNVQARNPDSLIDEKKDYFTFDSATQTVVVENKRLALNEWFTDSTGNTIRFVLNPNHQAPNPVKPMFFSLFDVKTTGEALVKGLVVTQATKLSSVIDMSLKDAVPKRGEDILNNLIQVYEKANVDDKNSLAASTLRFINERLGLIAIELDSVERGIQKYKTANNIIDISAQGQEFLDNAGANDQKLSEISVQLAVLDEVQKYVESKNNQTGIVPSSFGVTDPELSALLSQLYALEVQYAGLRKTTAENNPILLSLQNEIDRMKPSILENIQSQRRSLEAAKTNLSSTSTGYASILNKIPEKERGLIDISRQQTIKNDIYSFLLQKREETALSYKSAVADTRVVDDADTTPGPVSPKHMMIYLISVIVAFALGSGFIAIREVFNQNIVFRKDIEQYTSTPIIGEIMYEESGNAFAMDDGTRSPIAEQFRQLRTTLAYIGINNRKKKILVTSSIGGEGKSYIASNLGLTLALRDKKVVILELDLRKPKISRIFNINRDIGLTNYFVGDVDADHIIRSTEVNKNLFIIPSGPIPPNPTELILNGRLEELLGYLDTIFDYIIMDTAPVSPVTDAYIISPMTDATIYLVRHGVTPKMYLKRFDENMRVHPLKNVAIVFNGVKNRGMGKYGYGYGYGNGYGYGYGEDVDKKTKKNKKGPVGSSKHA